MCKENNQLTLMNAIRGIVGINIVTCGNCSSVILHRNSAEEVECYDCGFKSEPCDFPDLFYKGWDANLNKPKKWRYSVSTSRLWASFDEGEVEAPTYEEACEKALEKLNYDFKKVNDILNSCDPTVGFSIEFNKDDIEIEEIN